MYELQIAYWPKYKPPIPMLSKMKMENKLICVSFYRLYMLFMSVLCASEQIYGALSLGSCGYPSFFNLPHLQKVFYPYSLLTSG